DRRGSRRRMTRASRPTPPPGFGAPPATRPRGRRTARRRGRPRRPAPPRPPGAVDEVAAPATPPRTVAPLRAAQEGDRPARPSVARPEPEIAHQLEQSAGQVLGRGVDLR